MVRFRLLAETLLPKSMARKVKIPNEVRKRSERAARKRLEGVRSMRRYYLIVCEGGKTEPNYFEGLKRDLPKGVLTYYRIEVQGTGFNTLTLVDEALRLQNLHQQQTGRLVDRLWIVFDRDSFPPEDFNSAIRRCNGMNPTVGCAWSNEAFELWYLLHFHYYNNPVMRTDFKALIEENLRPLAGTSYEYRKNHPDMYSLLKRYGSRENAIRHARQLHALYSRRQDYANHNPCTTVYMLVEELFELDEESVRK